MRPLLRPVAESAAWTNGWRQTVRPRTLVPRSAGTFVVDPAAAGLRRHAAHLVEARVVGVCQPDLVERDFTAARPNQLWIVDFTYVATWSGMVFTAFVTDVFSRRIVGWRTAPSMPTELPLDALEMAVWIRAGQDVDGLGPPLGRRQPA